MNRKKLEKAFCMVLDSMVDEIGDWRNDSEFHRTPFRVAKAFSELLTGYEDIDKTSLTTFPTRYDGIIAKSNIPFVTLCPHHLLPIRCVANFAYMPGEEKLGISKIIRLIQHYGRILKPQEELTDFLIDKFMSNVECKGALLIVLGKHECESMRGIKVHDTVTKTSSVRGIFKREQAIKDEALKLIEM